MDRSVGAGKPSGAGAAQPSPPSGAGSGRLLVAVCLAQFMVILDVSVVNVALPSIGRSLGFLASDLSWVVNAYTLTFGGLLLLGGRLADVVGPRWALLGGALAFAAASVLGGLALTPGQLIAARAAQGVCAAVLAPATLTVLVTAYPEGPSRQRALGVWAAVSAAGGAIGTLAGGLLTDLLDWRWVLFVNAPLAAAVLVAGRRAITADRTSHRQPLDVPGAVLVTAGLTLLVFAVVRTDRHAWSSAAIIWPLVAAGVLIVAFAVVERSTPTPLVRPDLLRNRNVLGSNLIVMLLGAALFASFYFASLYLQGVLGYSPLATGLAFVPFSVGVAVGSVAATRLIGRTGAKRLLVPGLLVLAAGLAWFAQVRPDGSFVGDILGPSIVASLGAGVCFVANTTSATTGVARSDSGAASGLLNAGRQVGGSVGLAVLASVAGAVTNDAVGAGAAPLSALTDGYGRAFLLAAGFALVAAAVAAGALPRRRPDDVEKPAAATGPSS
jgi:EmrB/QacA subfamily drug resistance transporter